MNNKNIRICNECRLPATSIREKEIKYTPRKCIDCNFVEIFDCEECGEKISQCTYGGFYNTPPRSWEDTIKKRKCLRFKEIG